MIEKTSYRPARPICRPTGPPPTPPPGPKRAVEAPLVVVCAWHEDAKEQTAVAIAAGFEVTHGLCKNCQARLKQEMDAHA